MPLLPHTSLDHAIAHLPTCAGIYKLENKQSGKCYVGQAVNLRKRLGQHLRLLTAGSHHSPAAQSAQLTAGAARVTTAIMPNGASTAPTLATHRPTMLVISTSPREHVPRA